jgi:hypothetical protein
MRGGSGAEEGRMGGSVRGTGAGEVSLVLLDCVCFERLMVMDWGRAEREKCRFVI